MTETATTTTIRDRARAPFARHPVWTVGAIAAVIHLAVATRYGWHQDEFAAGRGARMVTRETLFATADIVSLHLVLAEGTRGIVGEPELRAMRPDAYLLNTARAMLIDQRALRRAVEGRWLAGVALDVFDVEPLPADHWLRTSPGTLLSPHMGYVSDANYRLFFGDVVEDIAAYRAGAPVRVLTS